MVDITGDRGSDPRPGPETGTEDDVAPTQTADPRPLEPPAGPTSTAEPPVGDPRPPDVRPYDQGDHVRSRSEPTDGYDYDDEDDGYYPDDRYRDDRYRYRDDRYPEDRYGGRGYRSGSRDVTGLRRSMRRRHPILFAFVALLLVVILLAGAAVLWAAHQIYPSGHEGAKVLVTVPAGASTGQIGALLAKDGVIHAGNIFRYYFKVEGGSALLPGTYLMARNEDYDQAIDTLQAGPVVITDKLVIPEGFTLREIAERVAALPDMHLSAAKFLALSSSGSVRSPLEPTKINDLEGLVFPATYTLLRTDDESTILEEMVGDFDQHMATLGLTAGAARLHMTPYQLIIVASIIQGEAKFDRQFPDVASVIYNRLHAHIALGTDSTLVYALRLKNPGVDVAKLTFREKSPYNTRLHKGLPPTPINSPSLPALAAAITPPHTDLKYFIAINATGNLSFASTNAGFQKLVVRCQANHLC